jgi:hypothetical protein
MRVIRWLFEKWKWIVGIVVSGTIVALWQKGEMPHAWSAVTPWLGKTWSFLTDSVSIPRWWNCLSNAVAAGWVVYLAIRLYIFRWGKTYRSYIEDEFEGIRFRWKWAKKGSPNDGNPCAIKRYCPHCDLELSATRSDFSGFTRVDGYVCTDCEEKFPLRSDEFIFKRITQKVRSGQWRAIPKDREDSTVATPPSTS